MRLGRRKSTAARNFSRQRRRVDEKAGPLSPPELAMAPELMCPILGFTFLVVCTLATEILVTGRRKSQ